MKVDAGVGEWKEDQKMRGGREGGEGMREESQEGLVDIRNKSAQTTL